MYDIIHVGPIVRRLRDGSGLGKELKGVKISMKFLNLRIRLQSILVIGRYGVPVPVAFGSTYIRV